MKLNNGKLMKNLKHLALFLSLTLCGCAYHCSKLYDAKTGNLVAKTRTYTLWDSDSALGKLHIDTTTVTNSHGVFSAGINIGSLTQSANSSNINALGGAMMQGAVKGILEGMGKP